MNATRIAEILRSERPDRGNTYLTRCYRTKGQAQYKLWNRLTMLLAVEASLHSHITQREFLIACGNEEAANELGG